MRGEKFYISVDLSERKLYVMKDGEQVGSYSVAVGQTRHPTPTGQFRIRHIVWNPRWVPPDAGWARDRRPRDPGDPRNPMGRVKLFFQDPDLYIHGTRETDSLGEADARVRADGQRPGDLAGAPGDGQRRKPARPRAGSAAC